MICELKRFEDMTAQEQREHLLDILTDDNGINMEPDELEELRQTFLQRTRQAKNPQRAYLTCKELGYLVGMHEDTIREMFRHDTFGVQKKIYSGKGRSKPYTTLRISRAAAKRRFPELAI